MIRPGNNSALIWKVFEYSGRTNPIVDAHDHETFLFPGWESQDDQFDDFFNFKWKPVSQGINFQALGKQGKQLVNHISGHHHLTTKDNIFLNLKKYYEKNRQTLPIDKSIYDYIPLTFVLDYTKENVGDTVKEFVAIHEMIENTIDLNQSNESDLIVMN